MTKLTKTESNRKNALKSTGPKSTVGKATSAKNRLSHGVLSSHLILPNENREEYNALLAELQQELMPQGVMEMALVERIAISLWRQRRLVRAESSEIELRQSTSREDALREIRSALSLECSDQQIEVEWGGLSGLDEVRTADEWLLYANMYLSAFDSGVDFESFEHQYPLIYQNLKDEAWASFRARMALYNSLSKEDW